MSTTPRVDIATTTPQQVADAASKPEKTLSQTLKEKFIECKNYVLKHKGAFAKIGQIGGTAALVTGGAALLFSGIAANLTIAGIPLGIPLMVAGGILLTAGTILQVAHHVEKKGLSVGEKIKGFFRETFNNLKLGTLAGVGIGTACAAFPLATLIAMVPVVVKLKPYLSKDLSKDENWKGFVNALPENSRMKKASKDSKNIGEFLDKFLNPVKNKVESLEKSDKDLVGPAVPTKSVQVDSSELNAQEHEDLAASLAMNIELARVAE